MPALLIEPMRIRARAAESAADLDFAEKAHREMIALAETVFPPTHPELARDLNAFAGLLASFRRFDEAEAIERRTVTILKAAYGEEGAKYAFGLHNLGSFIMFNGKAAEAVALFDMAIAIADRLPGQEDFGTLARFSRGSALIQLGRYADALAAAADAETRTMTLPEMAQARLPAILGVKMQALAGLGRDGEAIAAGREMLALGPGPTYDEAANLAFGMTFFAGVLSRAGLAADALGAARQALAMTRKLSLGGGSAYRPASLALVKAAWRAAP
jgi:tetratricopeptide (TPR) repeat protein